MKVLNLFFIGLVALGFIGCDDSSKSEKKVNKANRYVSELNSMNGSLNSAARADLSLTTAQERQDMKVMISDYIEMADYVIDVSYRDDVYAYGIDSIRTNRSFAAQALARINNYEDDQAEVARLEAEIAAAQAAEIEELNRDAQDVDATIGALEDPTAEQDENSDPENPNN